MEFSYLAQNKAGKKIRGKIEAENNIAATTLLREQELFVVNLKPKGQFSLSWRKRVSLKDKIIFTEQLGVMIKSGLPLTDALASLANESENKYFAGITRQIIREVEGGAPLSKAISKHPNIFSEIYINLVKSGEKSGNLDLVFSRLTLQLQKDYELTRKIRGALSYPIFVLCALLGVMSIVLIFIIPQLQNIFTDAGVELPLITKTVIGLSLALKNYGVFILVGVIGFIFLLSRWRKTNSGRHFFDLFFLKIPVIGLLLKKSYMARFCRTFASLISSGLPVLEVIKISGSVIGNSLYEEETTKMVAKVKEGTPISKALKESSLFPMMIGQLSTVGEKSGSLGEVFDTLANFFDRDVDNITSNLSVMLEPFLIVIMGIGIGAVILSVLQPIYGLVNAI